MGLLFGMAGLAEAGEAFALMVGYGGLLLVGLAAAIGLFARSRIAAGVALTVVLVVTLLYMPWEAFRPYQSDDPDVHHWVAEWRGFGRCWSVAVAAAVLAAVRAFGFPAKSAAPDGPQGTPDQAQHLTGGARQVSGTSSAPDAPPEGEHGR
jgi:hypothetical protein